MAKRRKKSDSKLLGDKLDKLWSLCVKLRALGRCEKCGRTENLNSHHVFTRHNYSTRWDLSNGFCLCAKCHKFDRFSAHNAPTEFGQWAISQRGQDWHDALALKAHDVTKPNRFKILMVLEAVKKGFQNTKGVIGE
jgi:hypothetical protein